MTYEWGDIRTSIHRPRLPSFRLSNCAIKIFTAFTADVSSRPCPEKPPAFAWLAGIFAPRESPRGASGGKKVVWTSLVLNFADYIVSQKKLRKAAVLRGNARKAAVFQRIMPGKTIWSDKMVSCSKAIRARSNVCLSLSSTFPAISFHSGRR